MIGFKGTVLHYIHLNVCVLLFLFFCDRLFSAAGGYISSRRCRNIKKNNIIRAYGENNSFSTYLYIYIFITAGYIYIYIMAWNKNATLYAREIIIGFYFILFFNNKIFCSARYTYTPFYTFTVCGTYYIYIYLNMLYYILQSSVIVHSAGCTSYFVQIPIILLQSQQKLHYSVFYA